MEINVFCDFNYDKDFVFSSDIIEDYAKNLLTYVIDNKFNDFYSNNYNYAFEIMICGNDFIHNINRDYRNMDKPTDVITFALFEDSEDKVIIDNEISLGQIIISADKVKTQALENNVTENYEFLNLLSHGILHLIGFDHPNDKLLENMLQLQSKMIESVDNVKI